jgi:hypothetical protein
VALAFAVGIAAGPAWKFLGERVVNDRLDHDVIAVTAAEGEFRALKLLVRGHAVHFLDAKVHFANGAIQDLAIRTVIPAGGETRVIDLRGAERVIRKVELWYEANSLGRGRAKVRLFGLR